MNKSVIITGASRGIGRATALVFAENGYDILICYRTGEKEAYETAEMAKAYGVRAIPFQMDIASLADCRRTAAGWPSGAAIPGRGSAYGRGCRAFSG